MSVYELPLASIVSRRTLQGQDSSPTIAPPQSPGLALSARAAGPMSRETPRDSLSLVLQLSSLTSHSVAGSEREAGCCCLDS